MGDVSHVQYIGRVFHKETLRCLHVSTCFPRASKWSSRLFKCRFFLIKGLDRLRAAAEIHHEAYKEHTHPFPGECVSASKVYENWT
jgi:hypothetical protein